MRKKVTNDELRPLTEAQATYLKKIALLRKTIGAPDELVGFFEVLPNFKKIVDLLIPAATEKDAPPLERLASIIDMVQAEKDDVARLFPKAIKSKRKTLKGCYGSHPHYSLYWHAPKTTEIEPAYRAMVASMLPVLLQLQKPSKSEAQGNSDMPEDVLNKYCMYLRQLSDPNAKERNLLLHLPQTITTIPDLIEAFEEAGHKYGIDLSTIGEIPTISYVYRVLRWFDEQEWDHGSGRSDTKRRKKRSPVRHGARDTTESYRRTEYQWQFDAEHIGSVARYFPPQDKDTRKEEAFDSNQSADETPYELTLKVRPSKVAAYFLENRRRQAIQNANYAIQAIEMGNQNLPVTRSSMSGYELHQFFNALEHLDRPEWKSFPSELRPGIAAWAACRFFLSRDEAQISSFKASRNVGSTEHPPWISSDGELVLPTEPPTHVRPKVRGNTVPVDRTFTLPIPDCLAAILKRADIKRSRVFPCSYEMDFKRLLKAINDQYQIDLTPHRVQRVISDQMSQLAPADWVISCYFEGRPPNQHNPAVYSVVPVERIQSLFDQACQIVGNKVGIDLTPHVATTIPGLVGSKDPHVGSLHVPQTEVVQSTVFQMRKEIARHGRSPGVPLHLVHNTYSAFVAVFVLATTGIRAVSNLIPAYFDFDPLTGTCFVSDKDNDRYGNAHLAWLFPELVTQLAHYSEHTTKVRQYLALKNSSALDMLDLVNSKLSLSTHLAPDRESDIEKLIPRAPFLFFLGTQQSELNRIHPSFLATLIGEDWYLRVGALRHFVRSNLLKANCSGEMINAQLGHGERGESAWGRFSTLPPLAWRKHLQEALGPIVHQLGFEALKSPLLCPSA